MQIVNVPDSYKLQEDDCESSAHERSGEYFIPLKKKKATEELDDAGGPLSVTGFYFGEGAGQWRAWARGLGQRTGPEDKRSTQVKSNSEGLGQSSPSMVHVFL